MGTAPQNYQTPKTTWAAGQVPTAADFNRIEGNIQAIEENLRTIDPVQVPTSNQGSLRQFLDWFANRIKAITGKTNWYDTPSKTLEDLNTHINAAAPHSGHAPLVHTHSGSDITSAVANAINADTIDGKHASDFVSIAGGTINGMLNINGDKLAGYAKTSNNGNTYSVTIPNISGLVDGLQIKVKFNATSTGSVTLNVNGLGAKSVVDFFGNPVTNVSAGLIANLVYNADSGNFILLGKGGGGTATADDIYIGKTATTDAGFITGTNPYKVGSIIKAGYLQSVNVNNTKILFRITENVHEIDVDSNNNLYLLFKDSKTVKKVKSDGSVVYSLAFSETLINIYVKDYLIIGTDTKTYIYDLNGNIIRTIVCSDGYGGYSIMGYDSKLYITRNGRIAIYDLDGTLVKTLNNVNNGSGVYAGFAIGDIDGIYVTFPNASNNSVSIMKINANGSVIWSYSGWGGQHKCLLSPDKTKLVAIRKIYSYPVFCLYATNGVISWMNTDGVAGYDIELSKNNKALVVHHSVTGQTAILRIYDINSGSILNASSETTNSTIAGGVAYYSPPDVIENSCYFVSIPNMYVKYFDYNVYYQITR